MRIFPLYYGTLFIVFVTAVIARQGLFSLSRIWIYAFYLQNIPPLALSAEDVGSHLWLSHFWSLAVEEQFYLLWPFLLTRIKSLDQAKKLCLSIFVLSALFRVAIWYLAASPLILSGFLFTRAGELAIGAYLAMCFRDPVTWSRLQRFAPVAFVVSLVGFLSAGVAGHSLLLNSSFVFLMGLPFITIFFAALVVLALSDGVRCMA